MSDERLDLGDGHTLRFLSWSPDRDLNPQFDGIPDVAKFGAHVEHPTATGGTCVSGIYLDSETARRIVAGKDLWTVESWEPLTLSPSLLCTACGDHGFVRNGQWVRA